MDSDYVVSIELTSKGRGDSVLVEIHDLEFSLALPQSDEAIPKNNTRDADKEYSSLARKGAIILRSNVTTSEDYWRQVPGDLVDRYIPGWFDVRREATEQQKRERYYYAPCATCRRNAFDCEWDGCDEPRCATTLPTRAAALERRAGL